MRFEKPRGQRLHKRFIWITNFSRMWWLEKSKRWSASINDIDEDCTNCVNCKTLRAFRRHLRKHPEIRGKAILVSEFSGYDIFA